MDVQMFVYNVIVNVVHVRIREVIIVLLAVDHFI